MWKTTLKSIGAHKRRLLATSSAVVLGVAFLAGTLVLGDTMQTGFGDLFSEANAGTDAVVRSSTEVGSDDVTERGLLDASIVDDVAARRRCRRRRARDLRASARSWEPTAIPLGGNGPPTQAGNWIADPEINPWRIADGRAPEGPGEVVIDRASADEGDLAVGDTTTMRTPAADRGDRRRRSPPSADADSAGPLTYAAFTTEFAAGDPAAGARPHLRRRWWRPTTA